MKVVKLIIFSAVAYYFFTVFFNLFVGIPIVGVPFYFIGKFFLWIFDVQDLDTAFWNGVILGMSILAASIILDELDKRHIEFKKDRESS